MGLDLGSTVTGPGLLNDYAAQRFAFGISDHSSLFYFKLMVGSGRTCDQRTERNLNKSSKLNDSVSISTLPLNQQQSFG